MKKFLTEMLAEIGKYFWFNGWLTVARQSIKLSTKKLFGLKNKDMEKVCVYVCERERDRQREVVRERERETDRQ